MDLDKLLKSIHWWQLVLICGVLLSTAAFIFNIQFIERRYVLGLGIGFTIIGIGYWKAKRTAYQKADGGMYSWDVFVHDKITKTLVLIGTVISIYFLVRLLIMLAA